MTSLPVVADAMNGHPNRDTLAEVFATDRLARAMSVDLGDWGGGWAQVAATAGADDLNFVGAVHGGFIYAAADVALSVASNSWGRICVAVSIDMHYLAPASLGSRLEARAHEQSRGRNIATYALEIRSDHALLATATGVTFRTRDWHLGSDAWTSEWRAEH